MTRLALIAMIAFAPISALADHSPAPSEEAVIASDSYAAVNHEMHAAMSAESTGDVDADFIIGMRAHHIGAVKMAEVLLAHGTDPATRELAQTIIDAQTGEIEWMTQWLVTHGYE
jgi:uncharacterized protein (DUF305 family)